MRFPGRSIPVAYPLLSVLAMIEQLFSGANSRAMKQVPDAAVLPHEALAANLASAEATGGKRGGLPEEFAAPFHAGGGAGASASTLG